MPGSLRPASPMSRGLCLPATLVSRAGIGKALLPLSWLPAAPASGSRPNLNPDGRGELHGHPVWTTGEPENDSRPRRVQATALRAPAAWQAAGAISGWREVLETDTATTVDEPRGTPRPCDPHLELGAGRRHHRSGEAVRRPGRQFQPRRHRAGARRVDVRV